MIRKWSVWRNISFGLTDQNKKWSVRLEKLYKIDIKVISLKKNAKNGIISHRRVLVLCGKTPVIKGGDIASMKSIQISLDRSIVYEAN